MVAEALRRRGVDVSRALVVVRSWNTATILAKPGGFSEAELAALGAWSDARWFDVDWRPGLRAVPVPRFHMTDDPVLFRAARAASGSRAWADEFAAAYLFRVAPATDAPALIAVGGAETDEFVRHSDILAAAWSNRLADCRLMVVPGLNHFTMLGAFADPASELNAAVRRQMGLG